VSWSLVSTNFGQQRKTTEKTMKISKIGDPRLISWIQSHPKKDDRARNPDEIAKGIFMADTAAALEYETIKTLGSTRLPAVETFQPDDRLD
jgi:hypothetical protein